jgi:hypothetical protein
MLPVSDADTAAHPERLEIFAVLGAPATPRMLRARYAFSDFDSPYRRQATPPAGGVGRMR